MNLYWDMRDTNRKMKEHAHRFKESNFVEWRPLKNMFWLSLLLVHIKLSVKAFTRSQIFSVINTKKCKLLFVDR